MGWGTWGMLNWVQELWPGDLGAPEHFLESTKVPHLASLPSLRSQSLLV